MKRTVVPITKAAPGLIYHRLPAWRSQPPIPGYQIAFYDDFEGGALDTSKWSYEYTGVRNEAYQHPSAVSVEHGMLKVAIRREAMGGKQFVSGGINTKSRFTPVNGYFEARVKPCARSGAQLWSAWWAWCDDYGSVIGDPASGTEMDAYESFAAVSGKAHQAIHWDGYGDDHVQAYKQTTITDPYGWHTYGCLWTPESTSFFIDGVETHSGVGWRVSTNTGQYWRLTCHLFDVAAMDGADEDAMYVDWVRIWRPPSAVPYTAPAVP